jgi:hypothetical protein
MKTFTFHIPYLHWATLQVIRVCDIFTECLWVCFKLRNVNTHYVGHYNKINEWIRKTHFNYLGLYKKKRWESRGT